MVLLFGLHAASQAQPDICAQLSQGKTANGETINSHKVVFKEIYGDESLREMRPKEAILIRLDNELKYRQTIGAPSDGVNFETDSLLLVFLGERGSTGYSVNVANIQLALNGPCQGHAYVFVSEKKPTARTRVQKSTTHPYQMILVNKKDIPVNPLHIHLVSADTRKPEPQASDVQREEIASEPVPPQLAQPITPQPPATTQQKNTVTGTTP